MEKFILSLILAILAVLCCNFEPAIAGECDSYEREKLNEGYYKCVYKDPVGIPTIGVGFNLKKFGAKSEIESVGADYDKVLDGTQCLDDGQIEQLFNKDMATAKSCASRYVNNYNSIGSGPQSAIDDMAFNLGCGQLESFRTLKSKIESKDFSGAAQDMRSSLWCRQVGGRCDRDVSCMSSGAQEQERNENGIL